MTQPAGFGKSKTSPKKVPSKGAAQRNAAAKQYDEMKSSGMPEYEIYIRVVGKNQWMPVGAIAVKRSSQVHDAIYANEKALLEGAFYRLPALKKNQANLEFEYGYRLKEYKDDPIELAVRPAPKIGNAVKHLVDDVGGALSKLFQKKSS